MIDIFYMSKKIWVKQKNEKKLNQPTSTTTTGVLHTKKVSVVITIEMTTMMMTNDDDDDLIEYNKLGNNG